VESPTSNTSSRRTRRSAALDTPQNQFLDDDFAETGWTLEQYLGLGDEDMAGQASPTKSSSLGTRASARVRKPTERLIESQKSLQKSRHNKATTPAVLKKQATQKAQKTPQKKSIGPKKDVVKASSVQKGNQVESEPEFERIKLKESDAARGLYELARHALGSDFNLSANPQEFIDELRVAYFKRESEYKAIRDAQDAQSALDAQEAQEARDALDVELDEYADSEDDAVNSTPVKAPKTAKSVKCVKPPKGSEPVMSPEAIEPVNNTAPVQPTEAFRDAEPSQKIVLRFKKLTPVDIETDGWVKTGRVNDSGEELVLTPTHHTPWRSPRTYGDDALPYPPVRSRSDQQAEGDTALGFPPLLGDRNIPLDAKANFQAENVLEEKARVLKGSSKTSAKTPAKADSKSSKPVSKKAVKNNTKPSKAMIKGTPKTSSRSSKTTSKSTPKSTPKSTTKATLRSAPKSAPHPKSQPILTTNTSDNAPSTAPATKVQRLTLKLGPAPKSEIEPTSVNTKLNNKVAKESAVVKGKKRKADDLSDDDEPKPTGPKKRATEKNTPVKSKTSANPASTTDPSTTLIIPTGRGRGSSRAAPGGSRGSRGFRGSRGSRSDLVSRGRGRGRGVATATSTGTHAATQPAAISGTAIGSTNFTRGKRGEARAARGPSRARGRGRGHGS
jgi:hypothetical protein